MTNGVARRAVALATSLLPVCCLHSAAPWSIAVVFSSFLLLEGSSLALALSLSRSFSFAPSSNERINALHGISFFFIVKSCKDSSCGPCSACSAYSNSSRARAVIAPDHQCRWFVTDKAASWRVEDGLMHRSLRIYFPSPSGEMNWQEKRAS